MPMVLLLGISMAVWGMASAGRLTWQAGLALLFAMVANFVWEARTASEEGGDADEENGGDRATPRWPPWPWASARR